MPVSAQDVCKVILAVLIPPLAVFLERGCGADLCINVLLTLMGDIPGVIHALYIILKSPDRQRRGAPPPPPPPQPQPQPQPPPPAEPQPQPQPQPQTQQVPQPQTQQVPQPQPQPQPQTQQVA